MSLNLASKPFVNRRPIRRIGIALWILVGLLALVNGILYLDYFRGSGRQVREKFLELQKKIRAESGRVESMEMELSRFDPEAQAVHVRFLNEQIADRVFGWGRLFDHLVDVMPLRVRLTHLQPKRSEDQSRKQSVRDEVTVQLQGIAESGDALYELVDGLYGHPAFEDPTLSNEFQKDGSIAFKLAVLYVPGAAPPEEVASDEAAIADGDQEGDIDAETSLPASKGMGP